MAPLHDRFEIDMEANEMVTTTTAADGLARVLHQGLPVRECRLALAGVSTSLLDGGDGPPLVLLHGQGAFAESWGPVIPALVARHRVIAPDLPGLGRSVVDTDRLGRRPRDGLAR